MTKGLAANIYNYALVGIREKIKLTPVPFSQEFRGIVEYSSVGVQ